MFSSDIKFLNEFLGRTGASLDLLTTSLLVPNLRVEQGIYIHTSIDILSFTLYLRTLALALLGSISPYTLYRLGGWDHYIIWMVYHTYPTYPIFSFFPCMNESDEFHGS